MNGWEFTGSDNYTVNALNQYTAVAAFTPTYDADGNQLNSQIKPLTSSSLMSGIFSWDAENRMIEVKNSSATTIEQNIYDASSRKIATIAGSTTTLYLYDGWNPIAEYTGTTPTLAKTNLWGLDLSGILQGAGGIGGLLSTTDHGTSITSHFPCYDGNGNITEYIDSAENVVAHYEYDPFGNTTVASGSKANDFDYRFSTKPIDPITGLYYYGHRWYDPKTGRWPSRDPIEEEGEINLYCFLANHAVNKVDHLGMATVTSGAYEIFWDLDINKNFEPYPGGVPSKSNIFTRAITVMKYHVYPKCCKKSDQGTNGGKFSVVEINLVIYSEAHLLANLLIFNSILPDGVKVTPDMNIFAYSAEQDHINDYVIYANSRKPLIAIQTLEKYMKNDYFHSNDECIKKVTERVMNFGPLKEASEDANIATVSNWDKPKFASGGHAPHEYPGNGWVNDPKYKRFLGQ